MASLNLSLLAPNVDSSRLTDISRYINKYARKFGITTPKRMAGFVAQAVHESDGFKALKEYGPDSYFKKYEFNKGLGNNVAGDGLKFKGRGIFQTTGRANYAQYSKLIFGDERLLDNPEILEQPEYAVLSAMHFWDQRKLNKEADVMDVNKISQKINGGKKGRAERIKLYNQAIKMLGVKTSSIKGFLQY
ncbi:MAG: glycoside hydrolase family 19 protein [Ferruginibacter sp.]|nr:glycoside hydrolase family 19 protein [Ferruginibacter sp.]